VPPPWAHCDSGDGELTLKDAFARGDISLEDLRYELWLLRDRQHLTLTQIAERTSYNRSTIVYHINKYRSAHFTPAEIDELRRATNTATSRWTPPPGQTNGLCIQCKLPRAALRNPGTVNPNADVLCDDCHEELSRGYHYADVLPIEKRHELGYD